MRWKLPAIIISSLFLITIICAYLYLFGIPAGETEKPATPKLSILVLPTNFITDEASFNKLPLTGKIRMLTEIIRELNQGYKTASSSGSSVAPWMTEWGEIERSEGDYDWFVLDLINHLRKRQGLEWAFELNLINTNVLGDYPDDIEFKGFDDPVFRERAKQFVNKLAGRYRGDLKYIWIGNEVNDYFQRHPGQLDAFLSLYDELENEIKKADPEVKTGIYVAYHLFRQDNKELVKRFSEKGDAIALSVYPDAFPAFPDEKRHIQNVTQTQEYFDEIMEMTRPARVAVTETGWSTRGPHGSRERQRAYVTEVFKVMERHSQRLEYFTWATLYDISEQCAKEVAGGINELDDLETKHREHLDWLFSTGLITADKKEKPAFRTWNDQVALMQT